MSRTTPIEIIPSAEANEGLIVEPSCLKVYESSTNPDHLSVVLISNDRYREVQGGLRLTIGQAESLLLTLMDHLGEELYDLGHRAGVAAGRSAGYRDGYSDATYDAQQMANAVAEVSA